ncbi:MAG: sulfite exporter TauE/SafE family protein [Firmicutes bacterium]|nr:sulfite exporter TauE/SafE family protein [Bacillota bacterium]
MTLQQIVGTFFLICAVLYAIYIIKDVVTNKEGFLAQPGNLRTVMICEAVVYFLTTIGISDFVMNTIVIKRLKLADTENLPDCLVTAGVVPGGFIAFLYLRTAGAVEAMTFLVFFIALAIGSFIGSRVVGSLKGDTIRKALVALLSVCAIILLVRTVMNSGEAGTLTELRGPRLIIMGICALVCGFTNMLGIPAKPFLTTAMLLLGLSPITTLTMILGAIPISVTTGGINVVRRRRYNKKHALSAATIGCVTAFIGCMLAISLNAVTLNVILIAVIIVAIISLIKK